MQLSVGQRYITRSGRVVIIDRLQDDTRWPFLGRYEDGHRGASLSWSPNGWYRSSTAPSTKDLMFEFPTEERIETDADQREAPVVTVIVPEGIRVEVKREES